MDIVISGTVVLKVLYTMAFSLFTLPVWVLLFDAERASTKRMPLKVWIPWLSCYILCALTVFNGIHFHLV